MSSEVCPFCGKIYKRLKSHLPHCKAAASPDTPPTKRVAASETTTTTSSSAQLVAPYSGPAAEPTQALAVTLIPRLKKKSKKKSAAPSPDSAPLPPPTEKTRQKPPRRIEGAVVPPSITGSLASSLSPPLPPPPVPKKQSLRASIEAAKTKRASEGAGSASEDRPSGSAPSAARREDGALPAAPSTADRPTAASEKKAARAKRAAEYLSATKDAPSSPDSRGHQSGARARAEFWAEGGREVEESSVNEVFLKPGSGHRAGISLQDVRATLGRASGPRRPAGTSVLSRVETTDKAAPAPPASPAAFPLLPGQLPPPPRAVSAHGGGAQMAPTHTRLSDPLPAAGGEASRGGDGLRSWLGVREQNAAGKGPEGALAQRRLAQVKLKELPEWLNRRSPSHPRDVVQMVQGGWRWYNKRYIDVKKGGVGGLGMLLAGYCALGYIWSYPHLKRDRWRKYH
ncbi:nascent polypeptide-associated complex subunit alpha, muscle-specific form [Pungitius pungitius]|uniref:nascent polypeptide-associated complex subunit alpha, muscle-specific form n=1 Tax=Pungitius pungitius TaxID=134920 RepID=UPI002E14D5C3